MRERRQSHGWIHCTARLPSHAFTLPSQRSSRTTLSITHSMRHVHSTQLTQANTANTTPHAACATTDVVTTRTAAARHAMTTLGKITSTRRAQLHRPHHMGMSMSMSMNMARRHAETIILDIHMGCATSLSERQAFYRGKQALE